MSPASKGTQVKKVPAARSASSRAGNKSSATKVAAKRPVLTKKKAMPVVKKAAPSTTKPTSAKKAAPGGPKKAVATAPKKSAPAKKTTPTPKKAAAAKSAGPQKKGTQPASAKKSPEKAPAKKSASAAGGSRTATGGGNGAGVMVAPSRTSFTPKPKPPPPVRPKTGPYAKDTKFLDEVRELLQADRAIYQEQATSLRAEADSLALEREPGDVQFDEESGEGGTVTVDRERNLALSGQATLAVEEIDDALARIGDKTYGYCERCFQPIPKPRLRALPYARLCVACKSGGLSRR
jgi:RNA polymerase-binding transcription factor DksA